jgi:hypothetical protein
MVSHTIRWIIFWKIREGSQSIADIRSLREDDCDTNHYLVVATIRKRLSLKKGIKQHLVTDRYDLNKLVDHQARKLYQRDFANGFSVDLG